MQLQSQKPKTLIFYLYNMRINKQTIRKGKEDKASVIFLTAKKEKKEKKPSFLQDLNVIWA